MKASTRLTCLGILLVACAAGGCDDDDNPPASDAAPDAASADAGVPTGSWRLVAYTTADGTQTDVDTPVGGVDQRVNGTLELDPASGWGAYTHISVVGDRPEFDSTDGVVGDFLFNAELTTLSLGDGVYTSMYVSGAEERLTLVNGPVTYAYERLARTPAESITLGGRVTIEAGTPTLISPRVGLVYVLRGAPPATLAFGQLEDLVEPGADVELSAGFGTAASDTASFSLIRSEGALGLERITFGDAGFAAVSLVVAYEDRDGDGGLTRFEIDACSNPGVDCIRGISPLVLAYQAGRSPELIAAGYGFLPTGWALGTVIKIQGTDHVTILPLDPTTEAVPVDVQFKMDPASVEYPKLQF